MTTRVESAAPRRRGSARARTRPRSSLHRFLLAVALVTCTVITGYVALGLVTRVWPALFPGQDFGFAAVLPGIEKPDDNSIFNKRRNLLIIGLDRRPGEAAVDNYRTDTLMVATLEPNAKTASVLSFPRDLLVDISGPDGQVMYRERLNASYGVGVERGGRVEDGAKQLQKDIERNFGIETDYWVVLDFEGVMELVDAIGGVDLEIPYELSVPDWWYSEDDENAHWVSYPAGPMHLDGYNAVAYGRYRNDSDLNRVKRQQLVLEAAFEELLSGGFLDNPTGLWNSYKDTVKTNISTGEMVGMAPLMAQVRSDIGTYSLGDPVNGRDTVYDYTTPAGAAVLTWDPGNVEYWLREVFSSNSYSNAQIEIWDGTGGATGSPEQLALYLSAVRGLSGVYMGPSTDAQIETRVVLYGTEKMELAEDVADWIGTDSSEIEVLEAENGQPDVVIVVGSGYHVPDS